MANLGVDRVIRALDTYSDAELIRLRNAINQRIAPENVISADDLEVMQAGTSGALNKIRDQRDKYKADADRLLTAIYNFHHYSFNIAEAFKHDALNAKEPLAKAIEKRGGIAPSVEFIHNSALDAQSIAVDDFNRFVDNAVDAFGGSNDPELNVHDYPELALVIAGKWREIGAYHHVTVSSTIRAHMLSDDPNLVAEEIILECRDLGEPSIQTIRKLPIEWIQEHLPHPPKSHNTLLQGLSVVMLQIKSKTRPKQYINAHREEMYNLSDRGFRNYRGWWDALEDIANGAS